MQTLVRQTVRTSLDSALRAHMQHVQAEIQARASQTQQQLDAQLAEVTAAHERQQVEMVLDGVISRIEHAAELEVVRAAVGDALMESESQAEATRELMPVKNFIAVGMKMAEQKATAKRLQTQLTEEQATHEARLKMEQATHARNLEKIREQLAVANERLQKLAIGTRSIDRADTILKAMRGDRAGRREVLSDLAGKAMPAATTDRAAAAGLQVAQFNTLLRHLETILYGSGVGDIYRTKLLLAALLERPAVRHLLGSNVPRTQRMQETAQAMLLSARHVLKGLGTRGTFTSADRLHFESIVTALTPDNASEKRILSLIMELLGISKRQLCRARKRRVKMRETIDQQGGASKGVFAAAMTVTRKQRKDYNEEGRKLCRTFWHQHTRFDTNARKKKRHRIGVNKYVEHWRHIQYDTNQEMWDAFQRSAEYGAYLLLGGTPISRSIFFEMKCWCIVNADNEECACPLCTQMFELVKDWDRQRNVWYRDADKRRLNEADAVGECACGNCGADGAYRAASKSVHALNDFVLCPKQTFASLQITHGPHACAEVKLRRRQCCRAPLLQGHRDPATEMECQDCSECGYERRMPECPVEHTDEPAEYKVYAPRGDSNQEALVVVQSTRAGLMAQLKKVYAQWLPHHWIKGWCDHQRRLTYSTFEFDEACISTDFSAVYDHKAWATKCCEQPHHSNMDVFVLTYSRQEDGKRVVYTEVVRVISEAKGNTHFHNVALKQIVEYMKTIVPGLKRIYLFTDGCKGQYKGRRNFARIAEFPSQLDGIQLLHSFSASHHFKGPHDQYGKDAKALARMAEKNKKRRMPATYDWYDFLATEMASPMKKARALRQVVDQMQATQDAIAAAREEEQRRVAAAAMRVAVRVRLNVGGSGAVQVGLHVPQLQLKRRLAQQEQGLARRKARIERATRKRTIVELGDGDEVTGSHPKERMETSGAAVNGIFAAHRYHWLFYGVAGSGLKEGVPFGQKCQPGECHQLLDEALEGDADSVPNSDSMYSFAGVNPRAAEGELYHQCYPCRCTECRKQAAPSTEYLGCPNRAQTGLWRRSPCHRSYGAVQRVEQVRTDEKEFAKQIAVNELLAAAADPAWQGRGGRAYWLLRVRSKAYVTRTGYKSTQRGVPGIRKGTLVVKGQWYDATDATGRKYKLLPETVHITVRSIIQEQQLEFLRGGSETGDSVFPDEQHARLMTHNFANYK